VRPQFAVDPAVGRSGKGSLRIAAKGNPAAFGNLRCSVPGIVPGNWYRLTTHYRVRDVPCERRSVFARLSWTETDGKRQHYTDLLWRTEPDGDWTRLHGTFQAPEKAAGADLELYLAWAGDGTVWWDDIVLEQVPRPPPRRVRLATVFHRPEKTARPGESVASFCRMVDAAAAEHPDLVCLPEGITVIGTGKDYCEVAEPVPGPTTAALGETARRHRCYLVAGLYERVGTVVYNTSVLIDREGQLVGSYRKTHLPNEEFTQGITPGDAYPVFATDFGTVGMMICWDVQFPEPARALAAKGAEIIFLPIWGGSEVLARARAIENHVTLVSSSYDMKTMVVNPRGDILCEASKEHPIAVTEVDLDEKLMQPWIGDMKGRILRERRTELRVPELER
jgi:predicted amidohydrolase